MNHPAGPLVPLERGDQTGVRGTGTATRKEPTHPTPDRARSLGDDILKLHSLERLASTGRVCVARDRSCTAAVLPPGGLVCTVGTPTGEDWTH